jgi:hypothetical protein
LKEVHINLHMEVLILFWICFFFLFCFFGSAQPSPQTTALKTPTHFEKLLTSWVSAIWGKY